MGFFDKLAKAVVAATSANQGQKQNDKLDFQEQGLPPEKDKQGRVIVRLGSGSQIELSVPGHRVEDKAIPELMGKPNEDFESKSVRLRIYRDTQSEFANSVRVETVKGNFVGWILKEDSDLATQLLQTISGMLAGLDSELTGLLVFDVAAKVTGYWSEDEEDGKKLWEPDIEEIVIRVSDPVKIEVRGASSQFETMPETHLKENE